ncbi:MAG TPA: hypothetical protein VFI09_12730 [Solirubrobacterales bacterium]|nr:hypothetical protein [Solirubrobacterales bacterium]
MEASQPAAPSPAKRIGVGDVISETFSIYGQNVAALLGSAIVVFAVVGLISGLLQAGGGFILVLLAAAVRVAGQALYTGFVVELVRDVRDGRRDETVGDLFSAAMPFILPLIGFGILFGIGVAIGFILIIVPGLILLTFWSVGAPAIVVEGIGPIDAFGRSWRLVRGEAWPVFGTLFVTFLIVLVIGAILGAIAAPIGAGATIVAAIVSAAITAPIYSLAVSVIFFDLGGGAGVLDPAVPPAPTQPPPPSASEPPPPPPAPAG